jgi:hypothetical protein
VPPNIESTPPSAMLMTPGERLGWVFRDRNVFRRGFPEPPPQSPPAPVEQIRRVEAAWVKLPGRMILAGGVGLGVAVGFACCGGIAGSVDGRVASVFFVLGFLAATAATGAAMLAWLGYAGMKSTLARSQAENHWQFQQAFAAWTLRKESFERDDWLRVDRLLEWGGARPDSENSRRVDIVGGNLWGWEAVLTVFGASLLSTRGPMTLVDLSGEAVSRELLRVAADNNVATDMLLLPTELADSDLLVGLDARQLVGALVESMYGDTPTAGRADRSMDERILTSVCQALGDELSMARLVAALRALLGETGDQDALTEQERRHICDDLFSDEYRRQAHTTLRRIEAFVHPLRDLGTRRGSRPPAVLTCLAMATEGRSAHNELLNDLIVQWLMRRVANETGGVRVLVIAAADEIQRRHIERLSDLCERRDIRLVLFFRHLREASVELLGGGSVGFMRLANHEEARRAADFVGRKHRFVVSQVTRGLGGNETHSIADTEGYAETDNRSATPGGTALGRGLFRVGGAGRNWNRAETRNWSVTRNWSQTRSLAEGSNWSDAVSQQRVYEYAVEPRTLQDLPDYALLLVQRPQPVGNVLVAVECNPDLVTMPRLSMEPLPELPLPPPVPFSPGLLYQPWGTAGAPR